MSNGETGTVTDGDVLLTPGRAAAMFCVKVATLRDWADADRVTVIKTPGGHRRNLRSEVEHLLADGTSARLDTARSSDGSRHPRTLRC